jgi:hypothetical protein
LQVPFTAHDLIAELEGRQDASAIEALTAMVHGGAAQDRAALKGRRRSG